MEEQQRKESRKSSAKKGETVVKTNFNLLWPWFAWRTNRKHGNFYGCGLPTTIELNNYKSEWSFELQVLGFGFAIERHPYETL